MRKSFWFFGVVALFFLLVGLSGQRQTLPASGSMPMGPNADTNYGKMPLYFIENQGQLDERVSYYIQGKDKSLYFTEDGVTFVLSKQEPVQIKGKAEDKMSLGREPRRVERDVVKLDFVGANREVRPLGKEKTEAVISYFRGSPEDWHTALPTYSRIVYRDLWPGIDLVYYGTTDRLKYEFLVHPGADPSRIRLSYRGAKAVEVKEGGRLEVVTPAGTFEDDVPVAWQEVDGKKVDVTISYELEGDQVNEASKVRELAASPAGTADKETDVSIHEYGFRIGDYDGTQTLVLDPAVIVYCGFVGGSGSDTGRGIAVDSGGNAYITGYTNSAADTFPVKVGPDLTYNGGNSDAFVAKVNSTGTALVYCGYIGGSDEDRGQGIAVDSMDNAYITGYTKSSHDSFPVIYGPDVTFNGSYDAFVAKVNPAGTALDYCGYIGGSGYDDGRGIAVKSGRAYITGTTYSTESSFPVLWGPDTSYNGGGDAFVAKVIPEGSFLQYCGYIGGSNEDGGDGIAVDSAGNAYVTGYAYSSETTFPVKAGPDLSFNGGYDAFVAKVDAAGTSLVYCGYIGGSGGDGDSGAGIAVDSAGNAYVAGSTDSLFDFPVKTGPDLTFNGLIDAFVAKVNSTGTALVYCGYIGGSEDDDGLGIALDGEENAYVTGSTRSSETTFPVKVGPDLTYNGYRDVFVAKVNSTGTALVYCGYVGGFEEEAGWGVAVDSGGNVYITGYIFAPEATFPVKVGPDLTYNGSWDAFVAKISYVGKTDFNRDGQEDILWRYYGPGGNNVVWYMGFLGESLTRFEGPVMNRPTGEHGSMGMLPGTPPRVFVDPREPAMILGENSPQQMFRDAREAGELAERERREPRSTSRSPEVPVLRGAGEVRTQGLPRAGVAGLAWLGMDFLPGVDDPSWTIVGTGDFNGDGKVDILWRYAGSGGYNVVWYMNSVALLGVDYLPSVTDPLWRIVGTGDFNRDGKVDILWRYSGSGGYNVVWYMNGVALLGVDFLPAVDDPSWKIGGIGDFNSDGKVDILWRYYGAGGYNLVWYMNGVAWLGMDFLPAVTDPLWTIAGTGDFNRDGREDILWRYYGAEGINVVWLMNGITWQATEFLPPVADPNWRIENH